MKFQELLMNAVFRGNAQIVCLRVFRAAIMNGM